MSYREELNRIRQNKRQNKHCYTSLKDDSTLDKLGNMHTNLAILRDDHIVHLKWNWDKLEDPGSIIEMWMYMMADITEVIKRFEKMETYPKMHDCNGICPECLEEEK